MEDDDSKSSSPYKEHHVIPTGYKPLDIYLKLLRLCNNKPTMIRLFDYKNYILIKLYSIMIIGRKPMVVDAKLWQVG